MIDTTKLGDLARDLDAAWEAWTAWQETWFRTRNRLEDAGYPMYRLAAYEVGTGRDEGGGKSMTEWLEEIESDLADAERAAEEARA